MKPKIKAYLVALAMFLTACLSCWIVSLIDKNSDWLQVVGIVFTFIVAYDYLTEKYKNE